MSGCHRRFDAFICSSVSVPSRSGKQFARTPLFIYGVWNAPQVFKNTPIEGHTDECYVEGGPSCVRVALAYAVIALKMNDTWNRCKAPVTSPIAPAAFRRSTLIFP